MSINWRRALLLTAVALPLSLLWLLPLAAQQAKQQSDGKAATASPPASAPEPAAADPLPADERISADNNLTFPVDI